jgi:glycosyltransferase involved in cell wall biosynthesis
VRGPTAACAIPIVEDVRDSATVTVTVAYTIEQCWHRVPGGTAMSALGTARAMVARGDVTLLGVAARHSDQPLVAWRPPMEVRHLPLPRRALYESWHTLRRPKVESVTGPVDLIHATGMVVPPRSAPLVVTVHDLAFVGHPEYGSRSGNRFFRRSLELTRRHADLVLCPSEATRRDCIALGIAGERVRVVPWGVEQPTDASRRADRLTTYGLQPGRYVLWVGTIEPRKNLDALIEAYTRLGRTDLMLALVGPKGWNEDLRARIAPIEDRVRVLGFVPPADLAALYAHAAVFCYPSLAEGFGLPVLEAMAAGAAVVTSKGTATEEVLGGCGLAVDPHDVDAITDALAALVEDGDERERLGNAARARAATFTWQRTAELTADAYRSVVT